MTSPRQALAALLLEMHADPVKKAGGISPGIDRHEGWHHWEADWLLAHGVTVPVGEAEGSMVYDENCEKCCHGTGHHTCDKSAATMRGARNGDVASLGASPASPRVPEAEGPREPSAANGECPTCGAPASIGARQANPDIPLDLTQRMIPEIRYVPPSSVPTPAMIEAATKIAERAVWWDGAGEDGCAFCGGEYIEDSEYIEHDNDCAIPVVRLDMIERLMRDDPSPDSPQGKDLLALVAAQKAHERAALRTAGESA